ncbi:NAD(P)/FAD-dependent oxidoreductase [Plastorhodobacter daqingensis]|uniref:NAD(P)/FAD-dependent oxidoreductase n=1 Tax=Plastorhodobacter daqingensis TaxID=1387281 RepID=A0ABW2UL37_9RHOB
MRTKLDIAVLGAGVVGAATARHIADRGGRVAVIDATGPSAGASGASDGAVSVASKKPGTLARLATASLLYTRQLATGGVLSHAFLPRPAWYFATRDAEEQALDALVAKLRAIDGPVQAFADGGSALLSGVGPTVRRIVEIRGEGHMTGYSATAAYLDHPGIERRWPEKVRAIDPDISGVTLTLDSGRVRARRVVVALGLGTPRLFPELPVRPRAGQLFVTDRGPVGRLPGALTAASYLIAKTEDPTRLPEPPVVIDPLATGQYLIGSSREEHGDPSRVDFDTMLALIRRAAKVWPALSERRVIRAFAGVRAATADGLPIVGPLPDAPNVIIATGFEGDGICLSALIGREVAQMALGDAPDAALAADLAALTPARFAAEPGRHQWAG